VNFTRNNAAMDCIGYIWGIVERSIAPRSVYIVLLVCAATGVSTRAQTFTTLASFNVSNGNGPNANAPLIQGTDGELYGTTFGGGPEGNGTVFKISLDGTLTTLAGFGSGGPRGGVIQGRTEISTEQLSTVACQALFFKLPPAVP
jgi:uncharacterized repeat protein (TIGR03803 family)